MNTLKINNKEGYSIVQLDRPKVNAINFEMVQELREVFKKFEREEHTRGVILSGVPHYFSAGLDLIELIRYDEKQIAGFFHAFGLLCVELLQFSKPFISAITGHAPAGGCVLAITSDNRFMAESDTYKIGLNEVAVNVQITQNLTETYAFWLGRGLASRYILEGKLLTGPEALSAGLVDALLPLDKVQEYAERKMENYLKADQEILVNTKKKIRKNLLSRIDPDVEATLGEATALWWKPEIRAKMEAYVERFSKKK